MTQTVTHLGRAARGPGHGRGRAVNRSGEHRVVMVAIAAVCGLAAVSNLYPVVEHLTGAALIAGGLAWFAVGVVRRTLRIRRRLANINPTTPAAAPAGGAPSDDSAAVGADYDGEPGWAQ